MKPQTKKQVRQTMSGKTEEQCIETSYCGYAEYTVVNSSIPGQKYIDGFKCKCTGTACIAKHYNISPTFGGRGR